MTPELPTTFDVADRMLVRSEAPLGAGSDRVAAYGPDEVRVALVVRPVRWVGEELLVELNPEPPTGFAVGPLAWRLEVVVSPADLVPAVVEPVRRAFPDGTGFEVRPGTQVDRDGMLVGGWRLPFDVPTGLVWRDGGEVERPPYLGGGVVAGRVGWQVGGVEVHPVVGERVSVAAHDFGELPGERRPDGSYTARRARSIVQVYDERGGFVASADAQLFETLVKIERPVLRSDGPPPVQVQVDAGTALSWTDGTAAGHLAAAWRTEHGRLVATDDQRFCATVGLTACVPAEAVRPMVADRQVVEAPRVRVPRAVRRSAAGQSCTLIASVDPSGAPAVAVVWSCPEALRSVATEAVLDTRWAAAPGWDHVIWDLPR